MCSGTGSSGATLPRCSRGLSSSALCSTHRLHGYRAMWVWCAAQQSNAFECACMRSRSCMYRCMLVQGRLQSAAHFLKLSSSDSPRRA